MKTTISYADVQDADVQACNDAKEYLGAERWRVLGCLFDNPKVTCMQITMALAIGGVEGFPVHALIRTYRPEQYNAWQLEEV